jgi:membrane protein DedA with SNARE-associated domain/rhodanese-related sulfurtransferase
MAHSSYWWDFGYYGIFGCVFLEQIGIPIPAFPALLAAGALISTGELSLPMSVATALAGALTADLTWYSIGRAKGAVVLGQICRISWRPDTCVSKTKTLFSRHGPKVLLISKFVPGLSIVASPLSGITQVPLLRFLAFDVAGILLWATVMLLGGSYLRDIFAAAQEEAHRAAWVMGYLPWVAGSLIVVVLVWRLIARRYYLLCLSRCLRNAPSAADVKRRLDEGEDLALIDIRHSYDGPAKPVKLPGARWIPYDVIKDRLDEVPRDRPVIVYCDCKRDQAAVAMKDLLLKKGLENVQPMRGGLDSWVTSGYPVEPLEISLQKQPTVS